MKLFVLCAALNLLFFTSLVATVSVSITPSDPKNPLVSFNVRSRFEVSCNLTGPSNATVKWFKDDQDITTVKSLSGRVNYKNENGVFILKVDHSIEDDAGEYKCAAFVQGKEEAHAVITAICAIKIKTPDNVNVVEGEKLRIVCAVIAKPPPIITWECQNETYTESRGRVTLQEDPDKKIPNAVFIINSIEMSDRGVYKCIAQSNVTEQREVEETMVRVKDKYAALWPFLGICAEVFVLCAIILVYEKKRNKTELEESDTDQSPDQTKKVTFIVCSKDLTSTVVISPRETGNLYKVTLRSSSLMPSRWYRSGP
ncbi:neuroplastin [Rhyzopertha dominica]|nr:neuroplastin [Rhyzopertha dominica]